MYGCWTIYSSFWLLIHGKASSLDNINSVDMNVYSMDNLLNTFRNPMLDCGVASVLETFVSCTGHAVLPWWGRLLTSLPEAMSAFWGVIDWDMTTCNLAPNYQLLPGATRSIKMFATRGKLDCLSKHFEMTLYLNFGWWHTDFGIDQTRPSQMTNFIIGVLEYRYYGAFGDVRGMDLFYSVCRVQEALHI